MFRVRRHMPAEIRLSRPDVAVRLRENSRARRFTLRPTPEGGAVLTMPPGLGESEVRGFLLRHADWLERALDQQAPAVAVTPGCLLPIDGVPVELVRGGRRRSPSLEGGRLVVGPGPAGPAVAAWLKRRTRARLAPLAEDYAARLGRQIAAISIRDTRSRWGSCSAAGRLGFSWRIAMTPPEVQAYLAAHEAAHLVEMNHSARYWAVLAGLMPDHARHRAWLRAHGRELHRYRFDTCARAGS